MNNNQRIRVGAVSYVNTKPLVYNLAQFAPDIALEFDLPSRLADRLIAQDLDVALIPSVEYFQQPEFQIVSDACIGCRGPVLSVVLLGKRPLAEIRTLALDEGSRTSAALAGILLKERFGIRPVLKPFPIGTAIEDAQADAILVIGDRAMHLDTSSYVEVWDLGDEWCRWAQLPFVFAMWVARPGLELGALQSALQSARDAGVDNLAEIARAEASGVGLSEAECLHYLRDNLYFYLGDAERQGLELFRRHAAAYALLATSI